MLTKAIKKYQVTIIHAYKFQQFQPKSLILWVYAASSARFIPDYEDIARRLKLPESNQPNIDLYKAISD